MDQLEVECGEEDYMGQIVIIKKDSTDGGTMPLLRSSSWTIGSDESCDLRIKNSLVRALHVKLTLEEKEDENFGETYVFQYQAFGPIQLNAQAAPYVSQNPGTPGRSTPNKNQLQPKTVKHGDVFRVGGRAFRVEYPQGHHLRKRRRSSTMMPRKPSVNFSPAARRRVDVMKTPTRVTKPFSTPMSSKRRVTFGNRLSPEIFDYRKPPDTPIRKGTTPAKKSNERKSILRDTPMRKPLIAVREESMTVPKLDLGDDYKDMPALINADNEIHESPCRIQEPGNFSFDVDPDRLLDSSDEEPERVKKAPSIEQVIPENRTTPTTPAEKRKARRKSSLFQPKSESSTPGSLTNELLAANEDDSSSAADVTLGVISDFDISDDGLPPMESTKVGDSSKMNSTAGLLGLSDIESKDNLEAEMTDEGASLNDTPKELNLTEHPTTPLDETKKVTSVGSMRKNATAQSRVTTIRTSAARRRTCGASPNSGKMRVKRFSADPKFLANAIKMYGMKLMKNRLADEPQEVVSEVMEILDKENKTPNKSCLPTPKMEKKSINIPTTPSEAINALPKPLMSTEIVVNRVEVDDTASPIQKALFQKDQTPAKDVPKTEAINKETEKQEELSVKKNSEHNVPQNSVTPGPTAMKGLFAEENKAKGNQTPHQSVMKGLFKEDKEQQAAATPIQGELHQMFKEQKSLPTPNVRKIFSELAQEMKTPDGKAMNNIFGDGQQKAEKEKIIPQNPVTPGSDAMTGLFGSKTPAVAPTANIFESPARENKEENPFATPGRGTKFSDFADSAFKRDESKPKENEVTPGQTAMKAIFEPSIEPQSPLLDASAIRNVFQSPNGSLVDLDNHEHVQSVCDITEDIKIGNTSIRQLINEAGDMNATPEQIALEYLIEGDPIEIKFDDEMSTSTASLRRLSEGASHRSRTRKSFIGKNPDEPNISTSLFSTPESDDDDEIKAEDADILQLDASMALDKSQEDTDANAPSEPKIDHVSEKSVSDVIAPRRRARPSIKPKAGQELDSPKKVGEPSNEEEVKDEDKQSTQQAEETQEVPEVVPEISVTAATPKRRGRPSLKPKATEEAIEEPSNEDESEKLAPQTVEPEEVLEAVPETSITAATPKRRGRPSLKPKATEEIIEKPTTATPKRGRPSLKPKVEEGSTVKDEETVEKSVAVPTPKRGRGRPSLKPKVAPEENSPTSLQSSDAQPTTTPKRRGRPSLVQKAKETQEKVEEVKTPKRRGRKSLKPKEEEHTDFVGEASGAPSTTPKRRSVLPSNEAFLSPVQSQESEGESVDKITTETESKSVVSKRGRKSNAAKAEESDSVEGPVALAEKNTRKSLLLMSEEAAADALAKSQTTVLKTTEAADVSDYPFLQAAKEEEHLEPEETQEVAAVEEKSKRRGRKAAQVSSSESATEEPVVAATSSKTRAKKEVAATPVRRSRRVSTLQTPKAEVKKEEKTVAKRRPRARKVEEPEESSPAKQAKIEEPEFVEAVPAEVSAAPRRTRRNSKTETAEAPKEEPVKKVAKRRKRDVSASAESSDNEAATKPTRGRKAKKENVAEAEETIVKSPKRAGRKSKKQEDQAAEDLPVEKSPVKKPGRKTLKVAEETVAESPKKKAGRPKKVKEADSSKEPLAESPKKKAGRPKKVKVAESSEDTKDSEAEQAEAKPKRGRKAKVEAKKDSDSSESPEETESTVEKPKRGRKAKALAEPEVEAEKPKRGRSKKTSSDESSQERVAPTKTRSTRSKVPVVVPEIEMEHVETVSCLKKSKRGPKSTVSFQEASEPEEEPEVEAKPAKKPAKKATIKKASKKTTVDAEEKPKAARGGRKKAAPAEKAAAEESETPTTRSSRSTRSQKQI